MCKLLVSGSDGRMKYVFQYLKNNNYDVLFAENPSEQDDKNCIDILITQPKPNTDNIIKLLKIYNIKILIASAYDTELKDYCCINNIIIYDYLSDKTVIKKNADLTAKGIIKQTLDDNQSLCDKRCLVTGYGNCAKVIAKELTRYTNNITIVARNDKLKEEIEEEGYIYENIISKTDYGNYDFIYNTIPAKIITNNILDTISGMCVIYDIASKPGGTDFEYANIKKIKAVLSLGIPGKEYPKEAGKIIYEYINDIIKKFN